MTQDFPRLSRREQAQFCKESKNPKLRLYSYLFLWAWLAENAPVFNIFKATDIGESMTIHTFGAYFGVISTWFFQPKEAIADKH